MSVIRASRRRRKPVSATIRSRANRLAVSTMIVRTPFAAMRLSASANPGRASRARRQKPPRRSSSRRFRSRRAWRTLRPPSAGASASPCPRRCWRRSRCDNRQLLFASQCTFFLDKSCNTLICGRQAWARWCSATTSRRPESSPGGLRVAPSCLDGHSGQSAPTTIVGRGKPLGACPSSCGIFGTNLIPFEA
jgi:hypothetical protein